MRDYNEAFGETTKLLLGKVLNPISDYEDWLMKRIPKGKSCKSVMDGKELYLPEFSIFNWIPESAAAGANSLSELSKRKVAINDNETVASLTQKLKYISTCIVEFAEGENREVTESTNYLNLFQAHKTVECFHSKYIAHSFWIANCDNYFGGILSVDCHFTINAHNSGGVNRAFEVDFCKNCSDVMFCHNCDAVRDSLFCFNTKNKRYAICNQEVGKEAYQDARAKLVRYVLEQLEKKHALDLNIYNIGARK